jgi:hypothetical protein
MIPTLNDPSLLKQHAYINGEWTEAASGGHFTVEWSSTL